MCVLVHVSPLHPPRQQQETVKRSLIVHPRHTISTHHRSSLIQSRLQVCECVCVCAPLCVNARRVPVVAVVVVYSVIYAIATIVKQRRSNNKQTWGTIGWRAAGTWLVATSNNVHRHGANQSVRGVRPTAHRLSATAQYDIRETRYRANHRSLCVH